MIGTYGDAGAISIFCLRSYCADHGDVFDIFKLITGDFLVIGDKEHICTMDVLTISIWSFTYALAEASHFVGGELVPNFGVFGVVAQLAVL